MVIEMMMLFKLWGKALRYDSTVEEHFAFQHKDTRCVDVVGGGEVEDAEFGGACACVQCLCVRCLCVCPAASSVSVCGHGCVSCVSLAALLSWLQAPHQIALGHDARVCAVSGVAPGRLQRAREQHPRIAREEVHVARRA